MWRLHKRYGTNTMKESHLEHVADEEKGGVSESEIPVAVSGNSIWAKLIANVYEVEPLVCTKCGGEMKVVAVIMDPVEVKKILRHLVKTGKSPPGLNGGEFNMVS